MNLKNILDKTIKSIKNNQSNKKNSTNLLILFLSGILIVIAASFFKSSSISEITGSSSENNNKNQVQKQSTESTGENSEDYETSIQNKLKSTLQSIEGVGKVDVMVSFEGSEEQVPAVNVNDSTNTTEEKDTTGGVRNSVQKNNGSTVVITNNDGKSEPLILKKYKPKVEGVCVVAEGAENDLTQLRITKAVMDLFNLPQDKVNVYPMKK
ncbi:stage III sporulation protein AG [Clostridium fermenticellae]|uniref:Stage III sporulation protein AG n=1 Tax=Clostridium fermenticellae TaxID=2068654 RepID=A0A386H509_9CLOT|nr:stage III sporulation protein AG [Clostridium fermenticellae]AYD40595.1 stage III sporulation protein AG [Clostridium fermenticellae]